MDLSAFLYRRLARWITCRFQIPDNGQIRIKNKYELASFQDVFCRPFYWQLYGQVSAPPSLIVDCGAHCGHFSILADICLRSKFPDARPRFVLVEPNPMLIPILRQNLKDANLLDRVQIQQGLLGANRGSAKLYVNPKNLLDARVTTQDDSESKEVEFIDLNQTLGDQTIDVMKIDIEGGEFDFVEHNRRLIANTRCLLLEMHGQEQDEHQKLLDTFKGVGLKLLSRTTEASGYQLLMFGR